MTPKIPIGVNVAVINDNKVLLTRRDDFEVWCLPGGATEPGESLAQAGIRETREETGLHVQLTRLVGLYSRPQMMTGYHSAVVFAAEIVGGELCCQAGEVIEIGYFGLDELPYDIMYGHRQRAVDALGGGVGTVRTTNVQWPHEHTNRHGNGTRRVGTVRTTNVQWPDGLPKARGDLYAMRDASGLSRKDFYLKHVELIAPENYELEVGGEAL